MWIIPDGDIIQSETLTRRFTTGLWDLMKRKNKIEDLTFVFRVNVEWDPDAQKWQAVLLKGCRSFYMNAQTEIIPEEEVILQGFLDTLFPPEKE